MIFLGITHKFFLVLLTGFPQAQPRETDPALSMVMIVLHPGQRKRPALRVLSFLGHTGHENNLGNTEDFCSAEAPPKKLIAL